MTEWHPAPFCTNYFSSDASLVGTQDFPVRLCPALCWEIQFTTAQAGLFDLAGDGGVSRATLRVLLQQFPTGSGLLERKLLSGASVKQRVPLPFPCTSAPAGPGPEQQTVK